MKLLYTLSFSLIAINSLFGQNVIKLSADVWPPFTDFKGNKSIATDIVSTAFDRIKTGYQFHITDFHSVLKDLESKTIDGSPAFWKTEEREKTMFYSLPYLQNQLILIGRKGTQVNFTSMIEMKGKKLGLVKDYGYGDSIVHSEDVEIIFNNNDQENLEALLSNKIDYMLVDKILIQYLFQYQMNDVSEFLSIAKNPFIIKSLYLAIRKDYPNAESIVKQFDKQIDTMIADGSYNRILNMNWIHADMDGDGEKEYILNGKFAGNKKPDDYAYEVFLEKKKKSESNRYFINGTYYEGWDKVPSKYKKLPETQTIQDPKNSSLKFNF